MVEERMLKTDRSCRGALAFKLPCQQGESGAEDGAKYPAPLTHPDDARSLHARRIPSGNGTCAGDGPMTRFQLWVGLWVGVFGRNLPNVQDKNGGRYRTRINNQT